MTDCQRRAREKCATPRWPYYPIVIISDNYGNNFH